MGSRLHKRRLEDVQRELSVALQDLGTARLSAGQRPQALADLAKASAQLATLVVAHPKDAAALEAHADALVAQVAADTALTPLLRTAYERLDAARASQPNRPELLSKLADLADRLGKGAENADAESWRRQARALYADLTLRQPGNAAFALAAGNLDRTAGHAERQRGQLPAARKAFAAAKDQLLRARTAKPQDATLAAALADAWLHHEIVLNELDLPADAAREGAALAGELDQLLGGQADLRKRLETRGFAEYHCGYALGRLGQWRQAEPHWQRALAAWRELSESPAARPDDPLRLARVERTYAAVKQAQGEAKAALPTLTVALQRVRPLSAKGQLGSDAKQLMGELHLDRARLCEQTNDQTAALADWRAAEDLLGTNALPARIGTARCLAKLGKAEEALALAEKLAAPKAPGESVYAAAQVSALLAAGAETESRAAEALSRLRRLRADAYFRDPERRDQLRDDDSFQRLRERPDFRKFEADLKIDAGNAARTT